MRTPRELLKMRSKKDLKKMISLSITLAPEEADRFLDYVVDESAFLNGNCQFIRMEKPTKNIRTLGLGSTAILYPDGEFDQAKYRDSWSNDNQQLSTSKVRGCIVIYDDDIEDNVEGDAFADHIMRMVTKEIANELDEAFWIGDTASLSGFSSDDLRCVWDGWRYRLDHSQSGETYENDVTGSCIIMDATNTVTAAAADFDISSSYYISEQDGSAPYAWEHKYAKLIKVLPSKYRKLGLADYRFFNTDSVTMDFIEALTSRATGLGDAAILGQAQIKYGLVPIVDVPLMSNTMEINGSDDQKENHDATNGTLTDCVLTHRNNFVVGIQRDVRIEPERSAADEATYWFYSMRADCLVQNVNAAVLCKRLVEK